MTDKQQFIQDWLQHNPQDDQDDALQAWKLEVKFLNTINDWDNQLDWNDALCQF